MRIVTSDIRSALPYCALVCALFMCGGAFIRSEHYRNLSDLNFSQTYEIQWRTTQIREHLTRIHGDLRLAAATGELDADLNRQIILLGANISQLLRLEYVDKFLRPRDIELLNDLNTEVDAHIGPIAQGATTYDSALAILPTLKRHMFEISGTAVAHAATLNASSHIDAAASRNRFIFAAALLLAAVGYVTTHLRGAYVRRRDQHLRSFSALYAHMTRSRVTALRLFLDYQDEANVRHPEMLDAAREAVRQLDEITTGLSMIAFAEDDPRLACFSEVVSSAVDRVGIGLRLAIEPEAERAMVPANQTRLVLEELIRNAEASVAERQDGQIDVQGKIREARFRRRRELVVVVRDNGVGMSAQLVEQAMTPFFSTKGGAHTGLGLAGCAQMITALHGNVSVSSVEGAGTQVSVRIPVG